MKVKTAHRKALQWLHSRLEHIEMSFDDLLASMRNIYDNRPSKALLKKQFEDRRWIAGETFSEYYHDKVIMANKLNMDEEELIDYMIDGISSLRLRDQARMQQFQSHASLLRAFRHIKLQSEKKELHTTGCTSIGSRTGNKDQPKPPRCYNCNQDDHMAANCPKPRREKGFYFSCGEMGHVFKDCPKKNEFHSADHTTTALIETPRYSVDGEIMSTELTQEDRQRSPIIEPTREYCVLLTAKRNNIT